MDERKVVELGDKVGRDQYGIKCPSCGVGFASRVPCSEEECETYGCGRDEPGAECCARAFLCMACLTRICGSALAPECDW